MFLRILKNCLYGSFLAAALSGPAAAGLYYDTLESLPDVNELRNVTFEIPMKIYTADHKLIGEFGESKRIPVSLEEIPEKLRQAFIAIEDSRFYEHSGIDPVGIMRAIAVAFSSSENIQGASTITQQLARNFFLSRERTLQRKLREIFISLRIEQILTKDEILELYLNKIALGHRSFGVAAAANTYYGKELKDLTLAEMATIAGLPKAPSTLNPISHPERSKERRHLVLRRMLELGYITKDEFDEADSAPYKAEFHSSPLEAYAPYVAEKARLFALEKYGEKAYTDGLEIYTSVHSNIQEAAHYAVFKGVTAYDTRHGWRGPADTVTDLGITPSGARTLLRKYDLYHYIHPAIVTLVDDENQSASLFSRSGPLQLAWDGMKWARVFKSDRRQGDAPKMPSEILKLGDIIYFYQDEEGHTILTQLPDVEASLIALNPRDGGIEALVGGYDFAKSKFDRTTQSRRQTGSNFKPFLYSAALARGISINSIFVDAPIKTWDSGSQTWWEPKNSPDRYEGTMTLREALAKSKNVVSIRLIRQIGVHHAVEHVKKFGFDVPRYQQVEAMALGSVECTPLELVRGYSVFANGGYRLEPYLVERIVRNGEVLYSHPIFNADPAAPETLLNDTALKNSSGEIIEISDGQPLQVLTHAHAYIVADLMHSVIYGGKGLSGSFWGTGSRAGTTTKRTDLYGKTGTTNNVHDAWFSGFNSNIVATAWMGFDTDRDLGWSRTQGPEGGAYSALPIWAEFIKTAQKDVPEALLVKPEEVKSCTNEGISDLCLAGSSAIKEGESTFQQSSKPHGDLDTSNIKTDEIF